MSAPRLIAPQQMWHDRALRPDMGLLLHAGQIAQIAPLAELVTSHGPPVARPWLVLPGLVDLQVNGGGGVMVNTSPTAQGIRSIVAAHRHLGTHWLLPTVITDHPDVLDAAAAAVIACHGTPGVLGLHIEGPHISPQRPGTHDPALIRPLDSRTLDVLHRLRAAGVPVMLTLAPETVSDAQLRQIAAMGVVLSAGHTAADASRIRAALAAGLRCFTHLYNAMPPMTSRAPGVVGAAILSDGYCGVIADGIHVDWDMARIACRARPVPDRMFLVSDAMPSVGGPDSFDLYGRTIRVSAGRLVNAQGALAGAHLDMRTALANTHLHIGLPLAQAISMATDIPLAAMGLSPLVPGPGDDAETLIALDESFALADL